MEREIQQGEESGLQANNGSPKGYGQPRRKKKLDRRVLMTPEAEQLFPQQGQAPSNQPENQNQRLGGYGRFPSQPHPTYQSVVDPRKFPQSGLQQQDQPVSPLAGLAQAQRDAAANGFTDIAGADQLKTGQFMNQLQGFNTNAWGSGERGTDTLKNSFGKIASNIDVTQPGALRTLLNSEQGRALLPDATIVEHANQDLLDPDGPGPMGPVDVIGQAVAGGSGANWWWNPVDQQTSGPAAPGNQIYNQALQMPQQQDPFGLGINPQQQESQAMQFLQWLMQQQQSGQLGGLGESPVMF